MQIKSIVDCRVENDHVEYLVKVRRRVSGPGKENGQDEQWVSARSISDPSHIQSYLQRTTKERDVELIVGAHPADNDVWYYVKWTGLLEGAWLPSRTLRKKYPQQLIKFFEQHLFLT